MEILLAVSIKNLSKTSLFVTLALKSVEFLDLFFLIEKYTFIVQWGI